MRRFFMVALAVGCFVSSSHAQTVSLAVLGVGPIYGIQHLELDGRPGSEYLVKVTHPLAIENSWRVVYPQHPDGLCSSETISLQPNHTIGDFDDDGIHEMLYVNFQAQTATFVRFPVCK